MVTAYNHGSHGEELVPVIKAILSAADEIDYAAAYKLGEANEEEDVFDAFATVEAGFYPIEIVFHVSCIFDGVFHPVR